LEGVEAVAAVPNAYNCTAQVRVRGGGLPDVDRWARQFKAAVGDVYVFRGVEVTVSASLETKGKGGTPVLQVPGLKQSIALAPLQHKLQWNFKKRSARQPEPDERDAYRELAARARDHDAATGRLTIQVTGPLRMTDKGYVLEVREYFLAGDRPKKGPTPKDK
jgi:hypothetical protein